MLPRESHGHVFHNRLRAIEGQVSLRQYGFGFSRGRQVNTVGIHFTGPEDFGYGGWDLLHLLLICITDGIVISKEIDAVAASLSTLIIFLTYQISQSIFQCEICCWFFICITLLSR